MTRISVGLLVLAVFQLASSYAAPFPQGKITFLIFENYHFLKNDTQDLLLTQIVRFIEFKKLGFLLKKFFVYKWLQSHFCKDHFYQRCRLESPFMLKCLFAVGLFAIHLFKRRCRFCVSELKVNSLKCNVQRATLDFRIVGQYNLI